MCRAPLCLVACSREGTRTTGGGADAQGLAILCDTSAQMARTAAAEAKYTAFYAVKYLQGRFWMATVLGIPPSQTLAVGMHPAPIA